MGKGVLSAVYQKMALPSPQIVEREGFYKMQDLIQKYPPQSSQNRTESEGTDYATLQ